VPVPILGPDLIDVRQIPEISAAARDRAARGALADITTEAQAEAVVTQPAEEKA
jgi:hypothetical protein